MHGLGQVSYALHWLYRVWEIEHAGTRLTNLNDEDLLKGMPWEVQDFIQLQESHCMETAERMEERYDPRRVAVAVIAAFLFLHSFFIILVPPFLFGCFHGITYPSPSRRTPFSSLMFIS